MDDYEQAVPQIKEHLAVYERVLERVRARHAGDAAAQVRKALVAAFEQEGLTVWPEVVDDAALRISGRDRC
ncbi:hypothetical protein [Streptomyces sp. YKOK-I1]